MKINYTSMEVIKRESNQGYTIYLVNGNNEGLIEEVIKKIRGNICKDKNNPFQYKYIEEKRIKDKEESLLEESAQISMFEEERTIEVELSNDNEEKTIKQIIESDYPVNIIIKGSKLKTTSKVVKAVQSSKKGIVIACYTNDNGIMNHIDEYFKSKGKKINIEAKRRLKELAGSDYKVMEQELNKLYNYALNYEEISEEDVKEVITNSKENSLTDLLMASFSRDLKESIKIMEVIKKQKIHAVAVATIFLRITRQLIDIYSSPKEINKRVALEKQFHFKYTNQVKKIISLWDIKSISRVNNLLLDLQINAKIGKVNEEILMQRCIMNITQANKVNTSKKLIGNII